MEDEKNQNVDTQTTTEKEEKQNTQNSETKNEGEKEKKTNATKNGNGSITFGSQEELDGFIDRLFAKRKESQSQSNNQTEQTTQETKEEEVQNAVTDYTSEIALSMAESGVDATKTRRLARLVDQSKCVVNGVLDTDKLKTEIESVIAEFPEFKKTATSEEKKEEKGFKFGAVGQDDQEGQPTGAVPKKKWNRFR